MSDYQFQFFLGDVPAFVVAEKLTSEKVTWQAINKWSLRMHADPQGEEREIMKAMFPFMMTAFALVLAWIQEKYKALKAAVGVVSDEMKGALRKVGNGMLQVSRPNEAGSWYSDRLNRSLRHIPCTGNF